MRGYIYQSCLTSCHSDGRRDLSELTRIPFRGLSMQEAFRTGTSWFPVSKINFYKHAQMQEKQKTLYRVRNRWFKPSAPDDVTNCNKVKFRRLFGVCDWFEMTFSVNLAFNSRTHCFKCRRPQWWNGDVPFNGLTGCVDIETHWSLCQRGGCPGWNSTGLWSEKESKSSSHDNVARGETPNTGCWLVCLLLYWFQTGMGSSPNKASGPVLSRQRSIN